MSMNMWEKTVCSSFAEAALVGKFRKLRIKRFMITECRVGFRNR